MKKTIGILFLSLLFVVAGILSQASAATVMSLIQNGPNQASDENREYLIDRDFVAGGPVGVLSVGDSLRGSININTMNSGGANLGGLTPNDELTGVFQVKVTTATDLGGGIFLYTFGVDPAFEAVYGTGAIVALFEGVAHDYAGDFTTALQHDDGTPAGTTVPPSSADVSVGPYASEEALMLTATDGSLFATLGFLGLAGEGASSITIPGTTGSVLDAFTFTSGTTFANANLGLNLLTLGPAATGLVVNRVTPSIFGAPVDFALSQQLRGVSDLNTPFEIASNTNISFNVIPEPSTLLLLGSGLLGAGVLVRRKMKK